MKRLTRMLDVVYGVGLLVLMSPFMALIALLILVCEGRPVFYVSERMKTPETGFRLYKFRTMRVDNTPLRATGGDQNGRITPTGRWLRRHRLDELPQLFNVLRGDMSFVGPRPPLRRYTEMFPDLYAAVLKDRPGITGLASLVYHAHEARILADCETGQETELTYCRRCIPVKAKLDLLYARHRTPLSDLRLMLATVFPVISMHRTNRALFKRTFLNVKRTVSPRL
ncbi:sugar transferase [Sagittula sp. SSi028]|uniref:sugar transferase n=1 Tax=Sagittula sp. SSi028 TaxID=3400636 RepID=UPI003AF50D74